jgi:integrase
LKPFCPAFILRLLRHTFATWQLEMGDPMVRVKALMGHTDANTLLRSAHLQPDRPADLLPLWGCQTSPRFPRKGA